MSSPDRPESSPEQAAPPSLHDNVRRVIDAGAKIAIEVRPRHMTQSAKTAREAADAIGVEVGQIVKSLIFGVDDKVVLACVSGRNQLDEAKLASVAGGSECRRVDADAVRSATGFAIGGVPPFGHATDLDMFVDLDLLDYSEVWAAAGTWRDVFPVDPRALVAQAGGTAVELKRD